MTANATHNNQRIYKNTIRTLVIIKVTLDDKRKIQTKMENFGLQNAKTMKLQLYVRLRNRWRW